MEDFGKYLKEDADEQERAAAEQVRRGLEGLRLEEKVKAVDSARKAWLRKTFRQRIVILTALAIISVTAFLIFLIGLSVRQTQSAEPGQMEQTPILHGRDEEDSIGHTPKPIAQKKTDPAKESKTSHLRDVKPAPDSATAALIKTLLKMTATDEPINVLPLWREVVSQLKKNNPDAAKRILFQGDGPDGLTDGRWLLAIALLQENKADEAQLIFEKIAADSQNPRQKGAQAAVDALR